MSTVVATRSEPLRPSNGLSPEYTELRGVIEDFFSQTGLPCPFVAYDKGFRRDCEESALRSGWSPKGVELVRPFLPGGVIMSTTAYAHLTNYSTRIYISLYTAALICLDDTYQNNKQAIMTFNERFMNNTPEEDPVLHGLGIILRDTTNHFDCIPSNIIITATLNLVTALSLEDSLEKSSSLGASKQYSAFQRRMSGAADAYAFFAFPPTIPWTSYVSVLPDLALFINYTNDLLSFYKEELAGETMNVISLSALAKGVSKLDAVKILAEETAGADSVNLEVLEDSHAGALEAYRRFRAGYVGFHASLPRYRLEELLLS